MKVGGSRADFTEEEVRGIITNPLHAGLGPFPQGDSCLSVSGEMEMSAA
jgi:hypothetical protein